MVPVIISLCASDKIKIKYKNNIPKAAIAPPWEFSQKSIIKGSANKIFSFPFLIFSSKKIHKGHNIVYAQTRRKGWRIPWQYQYKLILFSYNF